MLVYASIAELASMSVFPLCPASIRSAWLTYAPFAGLPLRLASITGSQSSPLGPVKNTLATSAVRSIRQTHCRLSTVSSDVMRRLALLPRMASEHGLDCLYCRDGHPRSHYSESSKQLHTSSVAWNTADHFCYRLFHLFQHLSGQTAPHHRRCGFGDPCSWLILDHHPVVDSFSSTKRQRRFYQLLEQRRLAHNWACRHGWLADKSSLYIRIRLYRPYV